MNIYFAVSENGTINHFIADLNSSVSGRCSYEIPLEILPDEMGNFSIPLGANAWTATFVSETEVEGEFAPAIVCGGMVHGVTGDLTWAAAWDSEEVTVLLEEVTDSTTNTNAENNTVSIVESSESDGVFEIVSNDESSNSISELEIMNIENIEVIAELNEGCA